MPAMPTLVALIGPVEPELFDTWTRHYRALGIERFVLGFHFPEHVPDQDRKQLLEACEQAGITPALVSTGPWHEHTNPELTGELRASAGDGWHLIADSDELHAYPAPLGQILERRQADGAKTVRGLMLDRVSGSGALTGWDPVIGLDVSYPLGGFLTHRLLRADPRKIVLAHASVGLSSGNHRAPGHRPTNQPPVIVHHFKWRAGIRADLERREAHSLDGSWHTDSPAIPSEARRLLDHLDRHGGRIDIADPDFDFAPVTLAEQPRWWAAAASSIVETWRPPSQNAAGSTISSPSPCGTSNRA